MKLTRILPKFVLPAIASVALLGVGLSARAGLAIPYTPNADTLHLWHLNETNGSLYAFDSTDLDTNSWPITLTNIGEVSFPFTNTSLGNPGPGFPGLTNAYSGNNKFHLLYGGSYPDVTGLCNPTSGAFTFEAIILISNSLSGDYEIFTGDNGGAVTARGWQWRFNTSEEQWDLLGGGTDNNFSPLLPTTGPDAYKLNTWYHVAVTFTGQSPTNGDTPSEFKMYWTLLDPSRTNADLLFTQENITNATNPGENGVRPLNGAPEGITEPNIGIGGSGRNTTTSPGNNEGLVGSIAEVRITDLCLKSNQMAFTNGGSFPPKYLASLPSSVLVGYGQPLAISASVSASTPSYFWYQNGALLPDQTNSTLNIPAATFADSGSYYLVTSNTYGASNSSVALVTVGAQADELYSTGIVSNQVSSGDVPDPNYFLVQSSNPTFLGPTEMIWESNCPIELICSSGGYAPVTGSSMWISDQGNLGGNAAGDPAGNYTIRTYFLLDQTSPTNLVYKSGVECAGIITNIILNGQSTGFWLNPSAPLYAASITMSNYNGYLTFTATGTALDSPALQESFNPAFFQPGLNTLDFVLNLSSGTAAIKVDAPSIIGYALPPGLPTILQQPVSKTVRDANATGSGTDVEFSVVGVGRPPLTYQWYTNGFLLPGGTTRTLNYSNAAAGLQGSNFVVVVANDSGSVTSQVAALTLVSTNQPPIAPNHTFYVYENQTLNIDTSVLYNESSDPSGGPITLEGFDTTTTNGVGLNYVTSTEVSYTPNADYIGADSFTYTIQDSLGATTVGTNFIQVIAPVLPTVSAPVQSNGNVVMSGAGGTPGGTYTILGSDDLTVPTSAWSVVSTGTFDGTGKFSATLPNYPGSTDMYYVLVVPLPND
jgi:hypothetical protein